MSKDIERFYGNKAFDAENKKMIRELRENGLFEEADYYEAFCQSWDTSMESTLDGISKEEKNKRQAAKWKDLYTRKGITYNVPVSKTETSIDPTESIIEAIDKKYQEMNENKTRNIPYTDYIEFISEMPGVVYNQNDIWTATAIKFDRDNNECVVEEVKPCFSRTHAEQVMSTINENRGGYTQCKDLNRVDFEAEWEQRDRQPSKKKIEGAMNYTKRIRKVGDYDEYLTEKAYERDGYTINGKPGPIGKEQCKIWVKENFKKGE